MRWVFLALAFISIPLVASYAAKGEKQRDKLILALGALLFATGTIALDAAIVTWPQWPGTSRGIIFSFVDVIAIALLLTRRTRTPRLPFLGIATLFLLPMVAATFVADVKMAALFSIIQYVQILFLYVVLSKELWRVGATQSLLKGMAIGLIIQAGYVTYQKVTGVVQAPGTFVHQNLLGIAVQLAAAPLLASILEGQRSKLMYAGVVAGSICVAGGGSRASMGFFVLAVVLTLLLSLMRRSSSRKWKVVGIGFVASLLIVPLAMGTLQDRFGTQKITTERDEARLAFERAAIAISADHPFGVGPNNFVSVNNTQGYAGRAGIEWGGGLLDKPVHNAYLLARAETGWWGQAALLLLLIGVVLAAYRTSFASRRIPAVGIAVGPAAGITTIALHSNYEFAWYLPELQRLFFINAALVAGCMAIATDSKRRQRHARRLRAAAQRPNPVRIGQAGTKISTAT